MEKNCLKSQLKDVASFEDAQEFDTLFLHVTKDTVHTSELKNIRVMHIGGHGILNIDVVGSVGYWSNNPEDFTNTHTHQTVNLDQFPNVRIAVANENFDIKLTGVSGINYISLNTGNVTSIKSMISFDLNVLGYNDFEFISVTKSDVTFDIKNLDNMPNLSWFNVRNCPNVKGNIGVLANRSFTTINLDNSGVSGSLEQFLDIPYYGALTAIDISNTHFPKIGGNIDALANKTDLTSFLATNNIEVTGSIESLVKLTSLTTLILAGAVGNSFIGSVENFVSGQIANGRNSVSISSPISCAWLLYYATFGGNYYTVQNAMFLTWESANKIIIYNNGTTPSACTNIYAKGATAEEIAAWEAAGKTVQVVS